MKRWISAVLFAMSLFVGFNAFAQNSPLAVGHTASIVTGSDGVDWVTSGYVECLNGCNIYASTPDAATLAALQYIDQNKLPGVWFSQVTMQKYIDICDINTSYIPDTACRTYISGPGPIDGVATSWSPESQGVSLNFDVCLQYYYPHGGSRGPWPDECGLKPRYVRPVPYGQSFDLPGPVAGMRCSGQTTTLTCRQG